jgi:hypothetical protein
MDDVRTVPKTEPRRIHPRNRQSIDNSPGVRRGQQSLDQKVEAIIRFAVRKKLESSGNCSVRAVYEEIRGDCKAISKAAPAPSTILDRIKALKADRCPPNLWARRPLTR